MIGQTISHMNQFVNEHDILLSALFFVLAIMLLIPVSAFAQQVPDKTFGPPVEDPRDRSYSSMRAILIFIPWKEDILLLPSY
jgi:hypothetical protein